MPSELDVILERLKAHFTVSEFVDFLDLEWYHLLDQETVLDLIADNLQAIKEEIGID